MYISKPNVCQDCKFCSHAQSFNACVHQLSVYWLFYVIQQLSRAYRHLYNKRVSGSSTLCLPSLSCSEFEPIWLEQWVISSWTKTQLLHSTLYISCPSPFTLWNTCTHMAAYQLLTWGCTRGRNKMMNTLMRTSYR